MILHKRFTKRVALLAASTVMCMNVSVLEAKDYKGHWAQEAISEWVSLGIIEGYEDGSIRPSQSVTRAELATLLTRVFKLSYKDESISYKDVKDDTWYHEAVTLVMSAELMNDYEGEFRPNQMATREEAAYAFAHAYHLAGKEAKTFIDSDLISDWAKEEVEALIAGGYLQGRTDGTLAPQDTLTRAEFITMLDKLTAKLYQNPGTYTEHITGNVVINAADVTLKDMTISGNLYITEGVGEGDVTLDNVKVEGVMIVEGGGEHSIEVVKSTLNTIYVEKASGAVRVALDDFSTAVKAKVNSKVQLEGHIEQVEVATKNEVSLVRTSIKQLQITEAGGYIKVDKASVIDELVANAKGQITGAGKVNKALINADNVVIEGLKLAKDAIVIGNDVKVAPIVNTTSGQSAGGGGGGSSSTPSSDKNETPDSEDKEESDVVEEETPGSEDEGESDVVEEETPGSEDEGDSDIVEEETPGSEDEGESDVVEEENPDSEDEDDSVDVESIRLSHEEITLLIGKEIYLTAEVFPVEAADTELVWHSDEPNVVSVDATGRVVANGIGEATITVGALNSEVKASCKVIVEGYMLSGKVTVEETNQAGINVLLYAGDNESEEPIAHVVTDASGEYQFSDLPKGEYHINAFYENATSEYVGQSAKVSVEESLREVDINCEKVTTLTIKAVDSVTNNKILYVHILVEGQDREGNKWSYKQETNGAGEVKFILPDHIENQITYTLKKDGYEEITLEHNLKLLEKNKLVTPFKRSVKPVYPEIIEQYAETEGTNPLGMGDTTYEALKKAGWRVESDTKLSTNSRRLIFENMNGKDGIDAKITYNKSGFEDEIKDYEVLLQYMIRKQTAATEGDWLFEKLRDSLASGHGPHEDGHRTITATYDGTVDGIVEIVFSNYTQSSREIQ